jgi:2-iminobutanoate/2-iminopropanoate deaminase
MHTPEKEIVVSDKAPAPIGPYSAGIRSGNLVFTAGQLGIDRSSGELVVGGIEAETRQALMNIEYILTSAGSSMQHVIKTTVFLRDMTEFGRMNSIYAEFFAANPPARSTVQVAALPKAGAVEIEAIAIIPS